MEIVATAALKIGMFVAQPDCAWTRLPFALQGFVLATPEEIDVLQANCRFVYVDRSRSLNEQYAAARREHDAPLQSQPFEKHQVVNDDELGRRQRRHRFLTFLHRQDGSGYVRELAAELSHVEPRFDHFQQALQRTFQNIVSEKPVDIDTIRAGLTDMSGSLQRNPDALMWLLRLKSVDQYSFDHAMDVAVYLLLLSSHLGWHGARQVELALAGLLQDVGKTQLPAELLNKTVPLSAAERKVMRSHVASSLEILYAQGNLPAEVMVIVSRHHERWDGGGYPRGLGGDKIGMAAEMAGLVDSFCAMLRNKPYRDALGHQEALEEIHRLRNRQFNPALMEQFVQCVGLYPIGTLLELSTGEVGVVIQQNRAQRARPRVLVLLDAAKVRIQGYQVVDLREPANASCRVARALPHNAYGLVAHDYYLG